MRRRSVQSAQISTSWLKCCSWRLIATHSVLSWLLKPCADWKQTVAALESRAITLPMRGNYKEETGIQNCATESPGVRLTGTNWKLSNGLLVCLRAPSVSSVLWHLRSRAAAYWPTVCVLSWILKRFPKASLVSVPLLVFFFPMTDDPWRLYIQSFDPTLPSKCTQNQITKTHGMTSDKRKEGS